MDLILYLNFVTEVYIRLCLFQILQLCLIGGSSLQDTVRRILRLVMSNSLALKYNWSGKGMKECFKNLKLRHTIISKYSKVTVVFLIINCHFCYIKHLINR